MCSAHEKPPPASTRSPIRGGWGRPVAAGGPATGLGGRSDRLGPLDRFPPDHHRAVGPAVVNPCGIHGWPGVGVVVAENERPDHGLDLLLAVVRLAGYEVETVIGTFVLRDDH